MSIIGSMVKSLRTQQKISQTELGKKIGVGKTTISNWETGYSSPDPDSLIKLSNIFNCSVDYLMGRDYLKNHEGTTYSVHENSGDEVYSNQLEQKVRELAKMLDIKEIKALKSIKSEGYDLKDLYDALKTIEFLQSKKKE